MGKSGGFFSMSRLERVGTLVVLLLLAVAVLLAVMSREREPAAAETGDKGRQAAYEQVVSLQQADTATAPAKAKKATKKRKPRKDAKQAGKKSKKQKGAPAGDKKAPPAQRNLEELPTY